MDDKAALIAQIERMLGYVPIGTNDLLNILTHPDVIRLSLNYVAGIED